MIAYNTISDDEKRKKYDMGGYDQPMNNFRTSRPFNFRRGGSADPVRLLEAPHHLISSSVVYFSNYSENCLFQKKKPFSEP